jgi:hypothetical protein
MCTVLSVLFLLLVLSQIDKKPIMNQKSGGCDAEFEGIKFVFNNKTVLELLPDMVAVLLVEL